METAEEVTWDQYRDANQIKVRASKKALKDHERALFTAWFNLYRKPKLIDFTINSSAKVYTIG